MKLIALTFAVVLFVVAAVIPPPYESYRVRIIAAGLAALVIAQYPL